jgi:D-arabinose 1-dehydrogenase-like Zn-dependent alcohol dehydrogenase
MWATDEIRGDKAGWGWVYGGCGECDQCQAGYQFHCRNAPQYYGATDFEQGSFSTYAVKPQSHVSKIPDGMDLEIAAPFLCAGQTVMTPLLRRGGVKKGERIGIVGVGGLGHLAIQFASKMGGEVVVFSGSESKREEAMSLGAKEFYVAEELKTKKPEKPLDVLLVTTSKHPDWAT